MGLKEALKQLLQVMASLPRGQSPSRNWRFKVSIKIVDYIIAKKCSEEISEDLVYSIIRANEPAILVPMQLKEQIVPTETNIQLEISTVI